MADLLGMSSAVIDGTRSAEDVGPLNRINHELSTIADGVAMVEAFSHCIVFETDDGLLAFDTSNPAGGSRVVEAVRRWRDAGALAARALELSGRDLRLACHLAELAMQAAPDDRHVHDARARVYQARRDRETSLMAKGIFGSAANDSRGRSNET